MKFKKSLLILLSGITSLPLLSQNITNGNLIKDIVPSNMTEGGTNRLATFFRANITGLMPGETYYYYVRAASAADIGTNYAGVGGSLFFSVDSASKYVSVPAFTAGNFDSFTVTNPIESRWFGFVGSSNSRFDAGKFVIPVVYLKSANPLNSFNVKFALNDSIKTMAFSTSSGANNITGIYGLSQGNVKDLVILYDTIAGNRKPLSIALIESDNFGSNNFTAPSFYSNNVDSVKGAWGAIVPNALANGVRRIVRRSLANNAVLHTQLDSNGIWLNINTKDPRGGSSTPLILSSTEAALVPTEVNFRNSFVSIDEASDSFTVVITRKYTTEDTASITINLVGGTATNNSDFVWLGNRTFRFAPGVTQSDSMKFKITDDNLSEGLEVLTLKLINPVNCIAGDGGTLSLTIIDNDIPIISFVDKNILSREDLGNVQARMAIKNGTIGTTTVQAVVKSKGLLTTIPGEFFLSFGNANDTLMSFINGLANDTIKLNGFVIDEASIDARDSIEIVLRNPSGLAILGADSILRVVIRDNDAPAGVRFVSNDFSIGENAGNAQVAIELLNRNANPSDFSLKYIPNRSSASEGSDFTFNPTSQIYSFGTSGSDSFTINIPIINDDLFEPNEVIIFAVQGTVNALTFKEDTLRITILNDDKPRLRIDTATAINPINGNAINLNRDCRITGVVHGFNRVVTGLEMTVIDATGGIQVASALRTFGYVFKERDSITVSGIISQIKGVVQISNLDTIILHKNNAILRTPASVQNYGENTEQEYVINTNVKFVNIAAWPNLLRPANTEETIQAVNAQGDTLTLRIDSEGPFNGTMAPSIASYYTLTGIGSQNDITSPFLSNYYLDLTSYSLVNSPSVRFEKTAISNSEKLDSTELIKLIFDNSGLQNTGFNIVLKGGTAVMGADFTFSTLNQNLISTVSSYDFQVNLTDNILKDGNRTILLAIRNPTFGVKIGNDSVLTITVIDDESRIKDVNPNLVKIYPNPAENTLTFESKFAIDYINIYNINGAIVANKSLNNNQILDITDLATGIYQLVFKVNGELVTARIQKK